MSYETDAAAVVWEPEGYPRVTGEEGTPAAFVPLGTADLRDTGWAKPGFATMGSYRRNGTVFVTGTTDWVLALIAQPGFVAGSAVGTITRNVWVGWPRDFRWTGNSLAMLMLARR